MTSADSFHNCAVAKVNHAYIISVILHTPLVWCQVSIRILSRAPHNTGRATFYRLLVAQVKYQRKISVNIFCLHYLDHVYPYYATPH